MPINPKLLAYQNVLGTQTNQPATNPDMNPIIQAYYQSLTTPTDTSKLPLPENIIPQTTKAVKESHGVIPSILQGLGGIVKLAGTGMGQRAINQMLGGDVYTGAAREQMAQGQLGQESAMRQLAGQQEMERGKMLGEYGLKGMELEGQRKQQEAKLLQDLKDSAIQAATKYGDLELAGKIRAMQSPEEVYSIEWKNPEAKTWFDKILEGFGMGFPSGGAGTVPEKPPVAGSVIDGYRYKGGNPSDPNNWESIK